MSTQRTFDCGCITDLSGGPAINLCDEAQELRRERVPHNLTDAELLATPFMQHFIRQFDPRNSVQVNR